MSDKYRRFIKESETVLEECLFTAYFSIAIELQKMAVNRLADFEIEVSRNWNEARAENEDHYAMELHYVGVATHAVACYISMWIYLKQDDCDSAFTSLVDAQYGFQTLHRPLIDASWPRLLCQNLVYLERSLFPSQMFVSPGLVFDYTICTICNHNKKDCEHISGQFYNGIMAGIRPVNPRIDHVSYVSKPADKAARVTSFEKDGMMFCKLTHRPLKPVDNAGKMSGEFRIEANALRTTRNEGIHRFVVTKHPVRKGSALDRAEKRKEKKRKKRGM